MAYVNRPPLAISSEDRQTSAKYNRLMPRTTGPFKVLIIRDNVLTIDENSIANTIPLDRGTSVGFQHRYRLLKSKNKGLLYTNLDEGWRDELVVH